MSSICTSKIQNTCWSPQPTSFVMRQTGPDMVFNDIDFTCLIAEESRTKNGDNSVAWSIDSGCTAQITFDRSLFVKYEPLDSAYVEIGSKANTTVANREGVHVKFKMNRNVVPCKLTHVLHVPYFESSMISVSRMADLCLNIKFKNVKCASSTISRHQLITNYSPMYDPRACTVLKNQTIVRYNDHKISLLHQSIYQPRAISQINASTTINSIEHRPTGSTQLVCTSPRATNRRALSINRYSKPTRHVS